MRTKLFIRLVPSMVLALLFASASPALGDPWTPPAEVLEPPVDPSTLVIVPTELPNLGEVLAEPQVVTDAELAGVGVTAASETLADPPPGTFVVDDDLAQCSNAQFSGPTGIQTAITAAPPGSTIRVCPGIYTRILIDKTLTLQAPRQQGTATQCAAPLTPDPTKEAIITGEPPFAGGGVVTIAADSVVFQGFTVQGPNTLTGPGIFTLPTFSGYLIKFNVIQENTFGIYFNASGALSSVVDHNCIRNNNQPGSASGDGIYSDAGLRNAVIQENFITGHDSAAIVLVVNQQDISIIHNDIVDDEGTIVLFAAQNVLVAYNHQIQRGTSSGIFIGGGVTASIRFNLIERASTGVNASGPNVLLVEKNNVRDATFEGIRFTATSGSTIRGNKVERSGRDGIRLRNGSNSNDVNNNLSRDNVRDGMRVDGTDFPPQSSMNDIQQNKMLGNGEHDCHDDTAGTGTGGTANTWLNDIGKTQNRPGLCKNASP